MHYFRAAVAVREKHRQWRRHLNGEVSERIVTAEARSTDSSPMKGIAVTYRRSDVDTVAWQALSRVGFADPILRAAAARHPRRGRPRTRRSHRYRLGSVRPRRGKSFGPEGADMGELIGRCPTGKGLIRKMNPQSR